MFDKYLGLESKNNKKKIFILPVPYESTVTYRTGTREGPLHILRASYEIESWDEELKVDIEETYSIEVLPFFEPVAEGPKTFLKELLDYIKDRFSHKDFIITLGGEHTIAISPISFYKSYYSDLVVLQMDAHADLRNSYQKSKYSHACVMRRIWDMDIPIIQLGIRSLSKEESMFIKQHKDNIMALFSWELEDPCSTAKNIKKWIGERKLYLTFDVDVLDPSILPGTGTPEPDGLTFSWVHEFFKEFIPCINLVGFDVCELSPISGEVVSESVTVKIINRILTAMAKRS